MSFWTKLRDSVVKPVAAAVLAPATGGLSVAVLQADRQRQAVQQAAAMQNSLMQPTYDFPTVSPGSGDGGMQPTAARVPQVLGMGRRLLTSARGIVSTMTGKIIGVMRGTQLFRSRQVARLAREVGIPAAATALGITAVEVAQIIASDIVSKTRRRARGISARDIRSARRTISKMNSFQKLIQCAPGARRAPARSAGTIIRQG